jgi:putative membrane protein
MFGESFLGQRGDALIDIGMLSIIAVVPVLLWSWALARNKAWVKHKQVQLTTAVVLGIVVLLFEIDLNRLGGIFAVTAGSPYAGTSVLNFWIWTHTAFAILSTIVWLLLVIASLIKFPKVPVPTAFPTHRYFGRLGMVLMLGSGLTAIPMYYYGFWL